jgi:hypothetical protein
VVTTARTRSYTVIGTTRLAPAEEPSHLSSTRPTELTVLRRTSSSPFVSQTYRFLEPRKTQQRRNAVRADHMRAGLGGEPQQAFKRGVVWGMVSATTQANVAAFDPLPRRKSLARKTKPVARGNSFRRATNDELISGFVLPPRSYAATRLSQSLVTNTTSVEVIAPRSSVADRNQMVASTGTTFAVIVLSSKVAGADFHLRSTNGPVSVV